MARYGGRDAPATYHRVSSVKSGWVATLGSGTWVVKAKRRGWDRHGDAWIENQLRPETLRRRRHPGRTETGGDPLQDVPAHLLRCATPDCGPRGARGGGVPRGAAHRYLKL